MVAPVFSRGVAKTVAVGIETSFGTASAAAGQLLRRTNSDLNLNVAQIQSQEILPSQQVRDQRQGSRSIQGTLAGQLHGGGYQLLFETLLRSSFAVPASSSFAGVSDSAATIDGNGNLVLTSASTTFTNKLHTGDVVRLTGLTGGPAIENSADMRVVAMTANSLTLAPPTGLTPGVWASGQTDTISFIGKKLIIPATAQQDKSFTLEHWYSDIGVSEVFTGCKVTSIGINIPANQFATIQASITGQNGVTGASQLFTGAAAASTATGLTAVTGQIAYQGKALGYFQSMSLQISTQVGADPVIGSNIIPAIFLGTLSVSGSLTALFTSDTMTADFLNENEVSLSLLLTDSPANNANFVEIHLPRVKLTSSTKNDSDRAIVRSYSFMALENTGSIAGADLTTIMIQDSLAA